MAALIRAAIAVFVSERGSIFFCFVRQSFLSKPLNSSQRMLLILSVTHR